MTEKEKIIKMVNMIHDDATLTYLRIIIQDVVEETTISRGELLDILQDVV